MVRAQSLGEPTPRIGIYWLHGDQVLGLSCALSQAEPGVPGLLDSPFTHVDAWEAVRAEAGLPLHIEYDDLPRGRVLYLREREKFVVYGDGAILERGSVESLSPRCVMIRKEIAEFFGFAVVSATWRHDSHYVVGRRRIDRLLDY